MFKLFTVIVTTALLIISPAIADETPMTRTITISGHGEVLVVPDMASVMMGVMSTGKTAGEALAANTATMTELMALLKSANIDPRDIATSNFSVNPRYEYDQTGGTPPKVVGYDVSNMVTVVVRKLDMLGDILDKAVSAGSNQINGINFMVAKPEAMIDEARKLSVADARRKAEIYAAAGGFALGDIVSVNEGGYQPPVPVYAKAMRADDGAAVPVAQGEQSLTSDVSIVWAIK